MGTVHLTNGHHGLYISEDQKDLSQRIKLDSAWLERPILGLNDEPMEESSQTLVRAALRGLLDLEGFDTAVSYHVVTKNDPQLAAPRRAWAEIYLNAPSNVIVGFSHDTRYNNSPFRSLVQWLEDYYLGDKLTDEEYGRFIKIWSSPKRWSLFFRERISRKASALHCKAIALNQEADELKSTAATIRRSLT